MINSVHRSHKALQKWAGEAEEAGNDSAVTQTMLSPMFATRLEWILGILGPVHTSQKLSESQKSGVFHVAQRWTGLATELRKHAKRTEFEQEVNNYLDRQFQDRLNRQLDPLHWAAFYLLPENVGKEIPATTRVSVQKVIEKFCGESAIQPFYEFRQKQKPFNDEDLWADLHPRMFWLKAVRSQISAVDD
jgi:hypothetical protein